MKHDILGALEGNLDSADWILLKAVQSNARLSYAELGRRANLSAPAAAERLRRLEDSKLILGYHARLDPAKLGLNLLVFIEIHMARPDYPGFNRAITGLSWILESHHIAGRASFLIKAAVPDTTGLELLVGRLAQFGETTTTLVLSTTIGRREFSPK